MTSYSSALTEEILAKKNKEQHSQQGIKKIHLKNSFSSSMGDGEAIVWKRTSVTVGDIVALFSTGSNRKSQDNSDNDNYNNNDDDDSSNYSDNTDNDNVISNRPRYILRSAEDDGSIAEDLPTLSTTADVRSVGVNIFCLVEATSGEIRRLIKLEEVDNESDPESYLNFENDSNGSSEIGSHKSAPIMVESNNLNSSYSSVGSLLSYKKNSVQMVDTLSTSQTSTSPPHSIGHSRLTKQSRATTSEPSETDTYTSGDVRVRHHFRGRDRMSSFHSVVSHVSGESKWGKSYSGCMLLVKVREPFSAALNNRDVSDNTDAGSNEWRLYKKLVIDVDSQDVASLYSRSTRGFRSRSSSVHFLPTIPSEDFEGGEYVGVGDDTIIIDNDDEEDDDDGSGMYYYDENNNIVYEGISKDINASIDSKASEDSTSFFGEFEIDAQM